MVKRTQERKEASSSSTLPIGTTNTRTTELPRLPRTVRKILGRDGTKAISKPLPLPQESEGPTSDMEADRHDTPRDTFLQIEPSHVTTKVFVAYGLLSASLQDHREKPVRSNEIAPASNRSPRPYHCLRGRGRGEARRRPRSCVDGTRARELDGGEAVQIRQTPETATQNGPKRANAQPGAR